MIENAPQYEPHSYLINIEEVERRREFFDEIKRASNVKVIPLGPLVHHVPEEYINAPLAMRQTPQFDMTQVLYGVIQAGTHGIGIAKAYGRGLDRRGQLYLTLINPDPYNGETKLITVLPPKARLSFDGIRKIQPELYSEGYILDIRTNDRNNLRIRNLQIAKARDPFLITADGGMPYSQDRPFILSNEIGTWAPEPKFVRRALQRARSSAQQASMLEKHEPKKKLPGKGSHVLAKK